MATRDTEYMYASARVRASEGTSTARERAERIRAAKSAAELTSLLLGAGSDARGGDASADDVERAASDAIADAVELTLASAPSPELLHFMLYPTDCVNVKAAIKAQLRGVPCDDLLARGGTVPPDAVLDMLRDRDFSPLPPHMRDAVPAAIEDYSKRRDPQAIDLPIDAACFADIAENVARTGSHVLIEYARRRADAANITTYLRLARSGAPAELLERSLVPGGAVGAPALTAAYAEDDRAAALSSLLSQTVYRSVPTDDAQTAAAELARLTAEPLEDDAYRPFGIEVLASFIAARSHEATLARKRSAAM